MTKTIVSTMLFLVSLPAVAQGDLALVNEEILVPVIAVEQSDEGVIAQVAYGSAQGLIEQGRGQVYHPDPEIGLQVDGAAELLSLEADSGLVIYEGELSLEPGDLVELPARVPQVVTQQLSWRLVSLAIDIQDEDALSLVTLDGMLAQPTADHDAAVFARGREIIREHAYFASYVEGGEDRMTEGRFRGKSLRKAMGKASEDDIRDYLFFVASFPGNYLGQPWRLTETWATWAWAGGFTSWREIAHRALEMKPGKRRAYVMGLAPVLEEDGVVVSWYERAAELAWQARYEESAAIIELMAIGSEATGSNTDWDYTFSAQALLLEQLGDYEGVIQAYEQSIEYAVDDPDSRAISLRAIASALRSMDRYDEAIPYYERSIAVVAAEIPDAPPHANAEAWRGIGLCHELSYRYPEALEAYTQSLEGFSARSDLKGLEWETMVLLDLADVHQALAHYAQAVQLRRQALDTAKELGWTSTVGRALDEMGASLWELGDYAEALAAKLEAAALYAEYGEERKRAIALTNAGSLLTTLDRQDEALEHYELARSIHEAREEWYDVADVLRRGAELERGRHNLAEAQLLLDGAAQALALQDDADMRGQVALEQAEVHQEAGRYEQADLAYEQSLAAFREVDDRQAIAKVLTWWAVSAHMRRDTELARERFSQALAMQEQIGDVAGQADTLRSLASYESGFAGAYEEAETLLLRSLELARQMPSKPREAQAANQLGSLMVSMGRFEEAQGYYQAALAVHAETGDESEQAAVRNALGHLAALRGDHAGGLALFEEAIAQSRAAGAELQVANGLDSLAWQLHVMGDYARAKDAAMEALAIYEAEGEEWGLGNTYNTLGSIESSMGDYRSSRQWHERSLEIRRSWADPFGEAGSLNNLGTIDIELGDFEAAAAHFEQALEIGRRIRYLSVLTVSEGNLARCLLELGRPDHALASTEQALVLARETGMPSIQPDLLALQGMALQALGRTDEADARMAEAIALAEELELVFVEAKVMGRRGILAWEQGQLAKAQTWLQRSVDTSQGYRNPNVRWEPLFYLARTQRDQGEHEAAVESFRAAVSTLEDMKEGLGGDVEDARSFQTQHDEVYRELVDLLNKLGRTQEAWEVLGLMKVQELRSGAELDQGLQEQDQGAYREVQAMWSRERELERQLRGELAKPASARSAELLARLQQELDELQLRFQDYTRQLEREHPDLHAKLQISPPSFFKLQAHLEPGEAFLEPVVLPDRVATFVVRGGSGPLLVRETPVAEAELDRLVVAMRAALEDPSVAWGTSRGARSLSTQAAAPQADPLEASQALYQLLIAPVLGDLEGVDTLVVSPSGRLRYLPFAALHDGEGYLVERFELAMLTQAGALSDHRPLERRSAVLALGNPDGSLPGAAAEVEALGELWRRKDIATFLGEQATKGALRSELEGRHILHLATHGYLLDDNPEGSFLLLAGEGSQARLTWREIPLLPLADVDLVVLSACQTALGDRSEGREISGLAYQFEMRGAASVIASLWEVDDVSTTALMSGMYGRLQEQGGRRAALLRQAQLELLANEDYAHPFHWAPFVLIGDWR
jgi:CHAT domain-containing protein